MDGIQQQLRVVIIRPNVLSRVTAQLLGAIINDFTNGPATGIRKLLNHTFKSSDDTSWVVLPPPMSLANAFEATEH
jgi:hypothetical protein